MQFFLVGLRVAYVLATPKPVSHDYESYESSEPSE
jgi:hypothetical protein